MANHPIVHVDLPSQDPATAAKFYEEAFGWKLTHEASVDYWMFSPGDGPGGGFVVAGKPYMGGGQEQHEIGKPLVYLGSEDLEADLARVEACGGRTILPTVDMGEYGAFAVFADPSGNHLGFYKSPATAA